jgi:hypothetical protein
MHFKYCFVIKIFLSFVRGSQIMLKSPSRENSPERKLDSPTTQQADSSRGFDVTQQMQRIRETGSPNGSRRESLDEERGRQQQRSRDFRNSAVSLADQQRRLDSRRLNTGKSRETAPEQDAIEMEPVTRRDSSSHSSDDRQHNQFEHLSLLEQGRGNEINNRLTNMERTVMQMSRQIQDLHRAENSLANRTDRFWNSFCSVGGGAATFAGLGLSAYATYVMLNPNKA